MAQAQNSFGRHGGRREDPFLGQRGFSHDWTTLKRVAPFVWHSNDAELKRRIFFCLGFVGVSALITGGVPLLFALAIDAYAGKPTVWAAAPIGIIAAYAATSWVQRLFDQGYFIAYGPIEQRITRRVSRTFFRHLHGLSLRFHLGRRTGSLSDILGRGLGGIRDILASSLFQILPLVIEVVTIGAIVLLRLSPLYAGVVLATLVAFAWVMTIGADDIRGNMRKINRANAEAHGQAIDSLINYETVQYFGVEDAIAERYDAQLRAIENLALDQQRLRSLTGMAQMTVLSLGLALLLIMGGLDVESGAMTVGGLVLVNTYLLRLARPLETMSRIFRTLRTALSNLEQMFLLLDEDPEVRDSPDAAPLPAGPCAIRFEQVAFSYDERRPILENFSFDLPAGRTLAIIGASGAGKSTIVRLLFRFYDPTEGRILIDGADLRQVKQASLRAAIAVVPQDTVLFNETLYDNIAFARSGATQAEIEAATRAAQLTAFVESLPDGWSTLVGERGLKLSGGEKQRVAIARALLKRPRIFIFDEATSSLDSLTEQAIQAEIANLSRGTTSLIIAHRLSTIVHADQILVLDEGRIVEHGNHRELVGADGPYARLWQRQNRAA
jgi:ATP-binding cassette, subfamily B, heavy metal transporter